MIISFGLYFGVVYKQVFATVFRGDPDPVVRIPIAVGVDHQLDDGLQHDALLATRDAVFGGHAG